MTKKFPCYCLVGLNIYIAEAPLILERALHEAFKLCRTETTDYSVAMRGLVLEDKEFIDSMPSLIRDTYEMTSSGRDPVVVSGPNGEFCVLAKGLKTGAYALCSPPYEKFDLCCQKLTNEQAPLFFQSVLIPVIRNLFLRQGKLLMHAGCVATPDGDGLLLVADSGGGKTTTSIALVRQGFRLVSDDLVVVSRAKNEIRVEGIREPMNVNRKTIAFFPELSHLKHAIKKAKEVKIQIDPREIFGDTRVVTTARASALMIVNVGRDGPKLVPIAGSSILSSLLKSHTFARGEPISSHSLDVLWPLLDTAKTFELFTGLEPERLGKWMAAEARFGRFGRACTIKLPDGIECSSRQKSTKSKRIARGTTRLCPNSLRSLVHTVLNCTLDGVESEQPQQPDILHPACIKNVLDFMQYHRIEVHMARWLQRSIVARNIATPINPKSILAKAMAISLDMQVTAKKIFQGLFSANIPAMMLRGHGLAVRYYPEAYLRHFRDIDVIVRENNLHSAEAVLLELGYKPKGNRNYWKKRGELPFSDGRRTIELHWDVYPSQATTQPWPINPDDFWNDSDTVTIDGFPIQCLSPNHLLLSSCLHISYEHKLDRLVRLVDLRQIIKMADNTLDWDWIVRLAVEGRNILSVGQALRCGEDLVDARIPVQVLQQLKPVGLYGKTASLVFPPLSVLARPSSIIDLRRSLFHRALKRSQ